MSKSIGVRLITDTGHPTSMSRMAPEFIGPHFAVVACGDNLDAPEAILSGGVFWGKNLQDTLPRFTFR